MTRAILLLSTNPTSEERTEEYNDWYSTVHLPQVLERIPGVIGARRYRLHEASPVHPDQRYLALYDIEADDPAVVLGALGHGMAAGLLDVSGALETNVPPTMLLYQQI